MFEIRKTCVIDMAFNEVPKIDVNLSSNSVQIVSADGKEVYYEPEVAILIDKFEPLQVKFLMMHLDGILAVYRQHEVDYIDDDKTYTTSSKIKLLNNGFYRDVNIQVYGNGELVEITLKWEELENEKTD